MILMMMSAVMKCNEGIRTRRASEDLRGKALPLIGKLILSELGSGSRELGHQADEKVIIQSFYEGGRLESHTGWALSAFEIHKII
jgi:hypothetical protein